MPIKNTFYVLESPTGASDAVLNNHVLAITGLQPMDYRKIETYTRVAPAAGAAAVATIAPVTGTAGTQAVVVSQYVKSLGRTVQATLSLGVTASTSVTDVMTAFNNQFSKFSGFNITVGNANATHLTLTAKAPDHFITLQSVGSVAVTTVNNTAAVTARAGYGADLLLEGFTGVVNANYYLRYDFLYGAVDPKGTAGSNDYQVQKQTLLIGNGTGTTLGTNANNADQAIQGIVKGQVSNSTAVVGTSEGISLAD